MGEEAIFGVALAELLVLFLARYVSAGNVDSAREFTFGELHRSLQHSHGSSSSPHPMLVYL